MTKSIYVLNGPNLNRLGKREPDIYGTTTLAEVEAMCREAAGNHLIEFRQSNAEHQLVDWIHEAIDQGSGIVINPAGLTFNSIPIHDALKMFPGPISSCTSATSIAARRSITTRSCRKWRRPS